MLPEIAALLSTFRSNDWRQSSGSSARQVDEAGPEHYFNNTIFLASIKSPARSR